MIKLLGSHLFAMAEAAAGSENYIGWRGKVCLFAVENTGLVGAVPEKSEWRRATYDEMNQAISEILIEYFEEDE